MSEWNRSVRDVLEMARDEVEVIGQEYPQDAMEYCVLKRYVIIDDFMGWEQGRLYLERRFHRVLRLTDAGRVALWEMPETIEEPATTEYAPEDVSAEYREGGRTDGAILTRRYVLDPTANGHRWIFMDSDPVRPMPLSDKALQKRLERAGVRTIKVKGSRTVLAYCYQDLLAERDKDNHG